MFWAGEGAGVSWPAGDASLIGLLAYVLGASAVIVWLMRRRQVALRQEEAVG